MRVSVIIPAHNEAGNIGRLVREVFDVVPDKTIGEVIVVDDASTDATRDEVAALLPEHAKLRYLRHGSRQGQSAALRTGLLAAAGTVIATMDGDGQNDPRDFAKLLERLGDCKPGAAVMAAGIRETRAATRSKRLGSRFANRIRNRVLKDECPDTGCGIKVFYREPALRLPYFTSMHRFLPALFRAYGHTVDYVAVNDRPRLAGSSKYTNLGRALIGLHDLFGVKWLLKRTRIPRVAEDSAKARRTPRGN